MSLVGQPSSPVDAIDAALPQTQCTRCGYPNCRAYAHAIVEGSAAINRCPPGGAEGVVRLAQLTGQVARPVDPTYGAEGPRHVAVIDEPTCIGCTRCIEACPVDCILGAAKRMHTVIEAWCTGCELCVPACPVDCIRLEEATPGRSGWGAWSPEQAAEARERYRAREARREHERRAQADRLAAHSLATPTSPAVTDPRQATITAALARARALRGH